VLRWEAQHVERFGKSLYKGARRSPPQRPRRRTDDGDAVRYIEGDDRTGADSDACAGGGACANGAPRQDGGADADLRLSTPMRTWPAVETPGPMWTWSPISLWCPRQPAL